ncbi:MAG: OmpP1/FadL family transporter [Myxococcaceae bacterium]
MRPSPLPLLFLLAACPALAGGFAVSEQDAAATGRAGTAIAQRGSASAVQFNPAGLAGLEGIAATAGATAIMPSATAADPSGGEAASAMSSVRLPPHVYAAFGAGKLSLGAGFNAPFGGGLAWPKEWRGRYEVVSMQLQVLSGRVAAAYQLTPELSLGASVSLYSVSVVLDQRLDFVDRDGGALLGGGGTGLGGALGLAWSLSPTVRLGVVGTLPTPVALAGRVHFSEVPSSFNPVLPDQAISTRLTLPGKLAAGAEVRFAPVRIFADLEYTTWSSFKSFDVDFEEPGTPDISQPRDWANTLTFRLGAEKDLAGTTLRAGAVFDGAASPPGTLSPSLPDSTRLGVSLGVGRDLGPLHADLGYQFVAFLPRASEGEALPAQYSASAHLVALSLGWKQ